MVQEGLRRCCLSGLWSSWRQ